MMYTDINFNRLPKINPNSAKEIIPKTTGIYFWFDKISEELVYIGIGAGSKGLYNRIVRQHLNPKYIEYRSEKHSSKDFYQLSCPVRKEVKGEMKNGIDQSAFRKNIGRALKIKPGDGTVGYIMSNLYLKYIEIENIGELKEVEKELIAEYKPLFNNSHK